MSIKAPKIITIRGYGPAWTFKCLDAASWLWSTKTIEAETIAVEFNEFPEPITPNLFLAQIRRFPKRALIRKLIRSVVPGRIETEKTLSDSKVIINNCTKVVDLASVRLKYTIWNYLQAYIATCIIWIDLLLKGARPVDILSISHRGICIGDIAAAHALRWRVYLAGKLNYSNGVFHSVFIAILHVNIALKMIDTENNYFMVPDRFYLPGILLRLASNAKASIIKCDDELNEFLLQRPFARHETAISSYSSRSIVDCYMLSRLEKRSKVLSYMEDIVETGNVDSPILDRLKCTNVGSGVSCIVYLHQISDAQYYYGLDGYQDLVEWADETIDLLCRNKSVSNVIIKFHPANVGYYKADDLFEGLTRRKFFNNKKVTFMDPASSVQSLRGLTKLIGITHHGSVAEELVYYRIPVVASCFSPWGNNYKFVTFLWSNRSEYTAFLESLSEDNLPQVEEHQLESLYSYVQKYRLDCVEYILRDSVYKYQYFIGADPVYLASKYSCYSSMLYDVKLDQSVIGDYVSWLLDKNQRRMYWQDVIKWRNDYYRLISAK
jgi:hypothetical protein